MKIIDVVQMSAAWWEARRGVPTASEFGRILTPKKLELASAADDYIDELIAEKLSPATPGPQYTSRAAHEGVIGEPEARRWYSFTEGVKVVQVGLCLTDDGRFGSSPDGLIEGSAGETWRGGLEVKRPQLKTHLRWLRKGGVPLEHLAQVHGGLAVTELPWWDFLSYVDVPGGANVPNLLVRTEPGKFTVKLRSVLEIFWEMYQARLRFYVDGDTTETKLRLAIEETNAPLLSDERRPPGQRANAGRGRRAVDDKSAS